MRQSDCRCDDATVARYFAKLSGPLLDRIDLTIEVARVEIHELAHTAPAESSSVIRARVEAARAIQQHRYRNEPFALNAHAPAKMLRHPSLMQAESLQLLLQITETARLSARSFDRLLRVARTIADLGSRTHVTPDDIAEAFTYRQRLDVTAR